MAISEARALDASGPHTARVGGCTAGYHGRIEYIVDRDGVQQEITRADPVICAMRLYVLLQAGSTKPGTILREDIAGQQLVYVVTGETCPEADDLVLRWPD